MHNVERLASGEEPHPFMRAFRRAQAVNSGRIDLKEELVGARSLTSKCAGIDLIEPLNPWIPSQDT